MIHHPFQIGIDYAIAADKADILAPFKSRFHFPQHQGRDCIYFCGNSLGLQPRSLAEAIDVEMKTWQNLAVGGYFGGTNPWLRYHEYLQPSLTAMMGASTQEITLMNSLTVNLHLIMLSFYKPSIDRYQIIMEAGAFPSDQYAIETLVKHFGLDPEQAIIEISPREGEKLLREEDILDTIAQAGGKLAMVMMGGINYYTGTVL